MKLHKYRVVLFTTILSVITGCHSVGPKNIDLDRSHYNDIVWQTDLEQLLKNIVRLRYAESSSYFQVTNVTASYSFVQSMSAQVVSPSSSDGYYPTLTASPSLVYSDSPTISYAPLGNAAFIASLEKPVDFNYYLLLTHGSQFDFDVMSKIMLTKIGPLQNSPSAVSMDVYEIPNYKPFYRFVDTVERMTQNDEIVPKAIYFNKTIGIMLHFTHKNSKDALLLKKMVHVPANSDDIIIMPEGSAIIVQEQDGKLVIPKLPNSLKNVVYAQTRSIESILTFLSHGVRVPDSHIKARITTEGYYDNNTVFDWSPMMDGIITIYSSESKPTEDVMIRTYLHNHWFYIKNSDVRSKKTLYLMIKLMDLVSVLPPQYQGPSLTLPG